MVNGLGWLERLGWERCKKPEVESARWNVLRTRSEKREGGKEGEGTVYSDPQDRKKGKGNGERVRGDRSSVRDGVWGRGK